MEQSYSDIISREVYQFLQPAMLSLCVKLLQVLYPDTQNNTPDDP